MFRSLDLPRAGTPPDLPDVQAIPGAVVGDVAPNDAQRSPDTLPASGARIIFQHGLAGGDHFLVLNDVDPIQAAGPRLYPDSSTARVVGRGIQVEVTPGHVLGIDVLALPSGPTQKSDGGVGWNGSGGSGRFELEVLYENGDGDSRVALCEVEIGVSVEVFAAEPPGAYFALEAGQATAIPWNEGDATQEQQYARGNDVRATWTLRAYGSPRPVDLVVLERPVRITVESDDTRWPTSMYVEGDERYEVLPSDYPIEQLEAADAGGGTVAIHRALLEHGVQFGPQIAWWGSGDEHTWTLDEWIGYDGGTGDDESPPIAGAGLAFEQVPFNAPANAENPAWTSGVYGRQVVDGDDFLDGRTGVLPVWVVARVRGGDAAFELRSGDPGPAWSAIEFEATTGVYETQVVAGWIEVGQGPENGPNLRLFARERSVTAGWRIRYLGVFQRQI